jgi:hypothetical protein
VVGVIEFVSAADTAEKPPAARAGASLVGRVADGLARYRPQEAL